MSFDAHRFDLCLALGKTFSQPLFFDQQVPVFKTLTGATQAAPVRLTSTAHGMPNGWPFKVVGAEGMTPLNLRDEDDAYTASLIDDDTVDIAGLDGTDWAAYTASSGRIVYNQPASLSGRTGVLNARATRNSTEVLFSLTSAASEIIIDDTTKRVTVQMTAAATTALITTLDGYDTLAYDMELPDGSGVIDLWTYGDITLLRDM